MELLSRSMESIFLSGTPPLEDSPYISAVTRSGASHWIQWRPALIPTLLIDSIHDCRLNKHIAQTKLGQLPLRTLATHENLVAMAD